MKGGQRVLKGGRRTPKPAKQSRRGHESSDASRATEAARQAFYLRCAQFNQAHLASKTYLTFPEFCAYGGFKSENAAYLYLHRNQHRVPKCRQGRTLLIRRRDYDLAIAPTSESKRRVSTHVA